MRAAGNTYTYTFTFTFTKIKIKMGKGFGNQSISIVFGHNDASAAAAAKHNCNPFNMYAVTTGPSTGVVVLAVTRDLNQSSPTTITATYRYTCFVFHDFE